MYHLVKVNFIIQNTLPLPLPLFYRGIFRKQTVNNLGKNSGKVRNVTGADKGEWKEEAVKVQSKDYEKKNIFILPSF